MPSVRTGLRAAAALFLLASGSARAEPVSLMFEQAIYVDGAPKEGKPLIAPEGVACNDAGAIVVADTGNKRLLSYAVKEGRVAGGTEMKLAQITWPVSVQLDSKGNALVLDGHSRKLIRVDSRGAFQGEITLRASTGEAVVPGGFKLDAADGIYVLDIVGKRVVAADANGVVKRQLPLPEKGLFTDVAVDAAGTVYAVDAIEAVVWSAEKSATAFKPLTKSLKDRMNFPSYMVAKKGRLFLVDQHGNGLVVLGIDGSFQGRQLSIGWGDGFVYYPSQLCMTEDGQVLVADRANNRVQLFSVVK